MFNTFSTAVSALNANSTAVNIVGNNLANLNTTGFKADAFAFHDLVSQALGSQPGQDIGMGVSGVESVRQFTQGAIQQTSGNFDAAINGDGFFVLHGQDGQALYTRAGNFEIDDSGRLMTSTGQYVQGWNAPGGLVDTSAPIGNLMIPVNGTAPAVATTTMALSVNLNAAGVNGAASGTFSTPVQVVDSTGGVHTLTVTFTKASADNTWDYTVTIPDADMETPSTTPLAKGTLTFDGAGKLETPPAGSPIAINIKDLKDGANDLSINWNLYSGTTGRITQFVQSSSVSAVEQNGVEAGDIVKVGIGDGGIIVAHYSNGTDVTVGQLAIASISNPDSMVAVGNNNLQTTGTTAKAAIGTAGTGGRGEIKGQALEASTVDIAKEFTNLIQLQRSYQADSRVITTTDEMLQDLISLKR